MYVCMHIPYACMCVCVCVCVYARGFCKKKYLQTMPGLSALKTWFMRTTEKPEREKKRTHIKSADQHQSQNKFPGATQEPSNACGTCMIFAMTLSMGGDDTAYHGHYHKIGASQLIATAGGSCD